MRSFRRSIWLAARLGEHGVDVRARGVDLAELLARQRAAVDGLHVGRVRFDRLVAGQPRLLPLALLP